LGQRHLHGERAALAGATLAAVTVPPRRFTSCLTSANPMPSPPLLRPSVWFTCANNSTTEPSKPAGMPTPLSWTCSKAVWPRRPTSISIVPPGGVCLMALFSRLSSTCFMRAESACTQMGLGRQAQVHVVPRLLHFVGGSFQRGMVDQSWPRAAAGDPEHTRSRIRCLEAVDCKLATASHYHRFASKEHRVVLG
jgi:hypothetical protein